MTRAAISIDRRVVSVLGTSNTLAHGVFLHGLQFIQKKSSPSRDSLRDTQTPIRDTRRYNQTTADFLYPSTILLWFIVLPRPHDRKIVDPHEQNPRTHSKEKGHVRSYFRVLWGRVMWWLFPSRYVCETPQMTFMTSFRITQCIFNPSM